MPTFYEGMFLRPCWFIGFLAAVLALLTGVDAGPLVGVDWVSSHRIVSTGLLISPVVPRSLQYATVSPVVQLVDVSRGNITQAKVQDLSQSGHIEQ